MVEPAFLGSGLNCGCEFPGSDSAFAAGELVCVVVVVALESDFAVAGLRSAGPPVSSDCARAPAVPMLGVFESELVCAIAGKVSSPSKKATITGLGK